MENKFYSLIGLAVLLLGVGFGVNKMLTPSTNEPYYGEKVYTSIPRQTSTSSSLDISNGGSRRKSRNQNKSKRKKLK